MESLKFKIIARKHANNKLKNWSTSDGFGILQFIKNQLDSLFGYDYSYSENHQNQDLSQMELVIEDIWHDYT